MTATTTAAGDRTRLAIRRHFTQEGVSPYDAVRWVDRDAEIADEKGNIIFTQKGCRFPEGYSQLAVKIVTSKYFYGDRDIPGDRETDLRQLIDRVTSTIADWGGEDGIFETDDDKKAFYDELTFLCLNQYASFNSPVWFNVGIFHHRGVRGSGNNWIWDPGVLATVNRPDGSRVEMNGFARQVDTAYAYPQASACFIQSVDDNMGDIMRLASSEAELFKHGSGTGTDLSTLRSSKEKLAGGGKPSGPVSFMRVYDSVASVIKSGGKTRRAAKMQTLKVWHPDIIEFIECKTKEEKKAQALIRQGYASNFNGEAYSSVAFQNANLTVRVTDDFLRKAEAGDPFWTKAVTTGQPIEELSATKLLDAMAAGAWYCGDPGVQYEDTIQQWHTCPNTAPINSSNPCSEYMFIDDSACNLSSINLMKFLRPDGTFDDRAFRAAVRIFIIAQDILVDHASYPTAKIAENSHKFRPLGLGYANLGALLMVMGLPYDSDEGCAFAGAITAILHGQAYLTSAEDLARTVGPFEGFAVNREPMLRVLKQHRDACLDTASEAFAKTEADKLWDAACGLWSEVIDGAEKHGVRNSQVTVLAPTGTIAFMMDCDTTGIEPDIALVKYKQLAGGGMLKIDNMMVERALIKLGYDHEQCRSILDHVKKYDTIEDVMVGEGIVPSGLKLEHLAVFDCAFPPKQGIWKRSISWRGHVKMMAAVQPFISGAISKTVNMDRGCTPDDIRAAYLEGWKLGLKALAVYRNGARESQPLSTTTEGDKAAAVAQAVIEASEVPALKARLGELEGRLNGLSAASRRHLPNTRQSLTHKFDIQGHEGYFTVGFFDDGTPGELFITMAKEGSTVGGLMDTIGIATSIGLQYGVPIGVFVNKFANSRFEPAGFTKNPDIPIAKSVVDYIFRWLGMEFIPGYREANAPERAPAAAPAKTIEMPEAIRHRMNGHPLNGSIGIGAILEMNSHLAKGDLSATLTALQAKAVTFPSDAPPCDSCGALTVRAGSCYRCLNCGNNSGACS